MLNAVSALSYEDEDPPDDLQRLMASWPIDEASIGQWEPLSTADVDEMIRRLERRRARGRGNLRPANAPSQRAVHAAARLQSALSELNALSSSSDPSTREAALIALAQAQSGVSVPKDLDLVQAQVFAIGRNLDDELGGLRRSIRPWRVPELVSRIWGIFGLLLTVLAAFLIALAPAFWPLAGALIVIRQVSSIAIGGDGTLPFESPILGRPVGAVYRCLAAHVADAVVLSGVAYYGAIHAPWLGVIAMSSIIAIMLGALTRTSALQLAIQVNRLNMERVIRGSLPAMALVMSFLVPSSAVVFLTVGVVVGPLAYGLGETLRTAIRIRHDLRGKSVRQVVLSSRDTRDDGTTELVTKQRQINLRLVAPESTEAQDDHAS
jgi:hypothetical protein